MLWGFHPLLLIHYPQSLAGASKGSTLSLSLSLCVERQRQFVLILIDLLSLTLLVSLYTAICPVIATDSFFLFVFPSPHGSTTRDIHRILGIIR